MQDCAYAIGQRCAKVWERPEGLPCLLCVFTWLVACFYYFKNIAQNDKNWHKVHCYFTSKTSQDTNNATCSKILQHTTIQRLCMIDAVSFPLPCMCVHPTPLTEYERQRLCNAVFTNSASHPGGQAWRKKVCSLCGLFPFLPSGKNLATIGIVGGKITDN